MKKTRENQGITLIALVITIIVLLILAGVAISMLSGENGILKKATEASQNTKNAQKKENARIILNDVKAEVLTSNKNMKQILDERIEKGDIKEVSDEEDGTYIVTIEDDLFTVTEKGGILEGCYRRGDTVKYYPGERTYTWKSKYAGTEEDMELDSSGDYKVDEWQILNINDDGTLDLISSSAVGSVGLQSYQGYNNGVKLLDDACKTLYGDTNKGINGRSIKAEDIERNLTDEGLKNLNDFNANGTVLKYGQQDNRVTNTTYPLIYAEERLSVIDGNKKIKGLERSEQYNFVEPLEDENGTYIGYAKPNIGIQPYSLVRKLNIKTKLKGKNNAMVNMLKSVGTKTSYWVATRSNEIFTSINMVFGILKARFQINGLWYEMSELTSKETTQSMGLRPVLNIKYETLEKDTEGIWKIK